MFIKIANFAALALSFLLSCNWSIAQNETMVFAVDVIRHGDRTPINEIPSDPHRWPEGLGQLTPRGMQQEFQLGTKFREEYVNHYHLLPENYLAESMYVRSSDIDRTLMSAECVLMGLYPLGKGPSVDSGKPAVLSGYQPIPIHTKPVNEDSLLVIDFNTKVGSIIQQYVKENADWRAHTAIVQPEFARWSKLTAMNIDNLNQVSGLGDMLHIRQIHHVPLPHGMSEQDAAEIMKEGEWGFAETFKPHQVGDTAGHELLEAIGNYFEQASQQQTKLKYVLFSSHDTTIASVMSAMRTPLDQRPPYSSDLSFALFKDGDSFKVRVELNGKPVTVSGSTNGKIPLQNFLALIKQSK